MGTLCERKGLLGMGCFRLFAAVFSGSLQAMPPVGFGPAVQKGCVLTFNPSPAFGRDSANDFRDTFLPSPSHEFPGARARLGPSGVMPRPAVWPSLGHDLPGPCLALPAPVPSAAPLSRPCPGCIPRRSAYSCTPARAGTVAWSRGSAARVWPVASFLESPLQLARPALRDTPTPGSGAGQGPSGGDDNASLGEAIVVPHTFRCLMHAGKHAIGPTGQVMSTDERPCHISSRPSSAS
jgi:hypothetical protein